MNAAAKAPDARPWRVVVVDDSPDDRAEARRMLLIGAERRYAFVEAETGAEAVRAVLGADGGPPDCLLLDYDLPDMNAVEVLAALRGGNNLVVCPVVVFTGGTGAELGRAVLRAGAQDYVDKGWLTPAGLTRSLENAIERWTMARELGERKAALREREQQLALAFEAAELMYFSWDIATDRFERRLSRFSTVPPTAGAAPEPVTFAAVRAAVYADDQAAFEANMQAALGGRGEYANAFRVTKPDGALSWVEERGRVLFDEGGRPTRLFGVTADVTERRHEAERRALLAEVAQTILEAPAADAALSERIFGMVRESLRVDVLLNYRLEGGALRLVAAAGVAATSDAASRRLELGQSFCGLVAATRAPLAADAERIRAEPLGALVRQLRVRAYACHPLLGRDSEVLGTFAVAGTAREAFEPADVQFLQTVSHLLAMSWERQQAEQRRAFLFDLSERLRDLTTPAEVADEATRALGERLYVAQVGYGEIDEAQGQVIVDRDWNDGRLASGVGAWRSDDFGPAVLHEMRAGATVAIADVERDPRTNAPPVRRAYEGVGTRALLGVPLLKGGCMAAILFVRHPEPRAWTPADVGLAREVAERLWAAMGRAQAETSLRARERELQALADNSPDILTRFDRALRHVFVNVAVEQATGRPRAEFLGKTNRELGMPAELCDLWEAALRQVFETGRSSSLAFTFEGPQGSRDFEARLVPEFGAEGQVEWALVVTHDVTVQKAHERALQEADRRKDEFLATLAHELRNPLAPLRSSLAVLYQAPTGEAAARARATMGRQLGHLVRLVDDLLDVSRVSRGKIELRRSRLRLHDVVEHALEASRPLFEAARHTLAVEVPEEAVWVDGDLTRLSQVVSNLLNNAAKYTPNGGRVVLTSGAAAGKAFVRVADNGAGIAAEMLPRVFDLFAQIEHTLDRAQGGLGIGLSLALKLVTLHGGTLEAASEGLGRGSVFTMRLPLAAAVGRAELLSLAETARPAPEAHSSRRVLVVDDNIDGAAMLAMTLDLDGHHTVLAQSGPEALRVARLFNPDVAFLDIGLPGMSGYELARAFRQDDALARVVLVALTGWGSEDDKRKSREAGFDAHLTKPVEPEAIERVLSRLGAPTAGDSHGRVKAGAATDLAAPFEPRTPPI